MKHKIVIEIDGIRHKGTSNCPKDWKNVCKYCSLEKYCPDIIGSPCNTTINHFILEK